MLLLATRSLAGDEKPGGNLREPPAHAERYTSLLGGRVSSGPAFSFPEKFPDPGDIAFVDSLVPLERYHRGWVADEIPGRSPVVAVFEGGHAVSVCCCARRSEVAAEAGLETARPFADAASVRASGRTPFCSMSWDNHASLAVARKLGLHAYSSSWSIYG